MQRALAIWEKALGPDHPEVATSLNNLAGLYRPRASTPRPSRSTSAPWRSGRRPSARTIPTSPQPQQPGGALLCPGPVRQGRAALSARTRDPGAGPRPGPSRRRHKPQQPGRALPHPGPVRQGRAALSARTRHPGEGPRPRPSRRGHEPQQPGRALRAQGQYAKAEPLYQRSLAIWEKALGPDHPEVATSLNNLAVLYRRPRRVRQGRAALSALTRHPGEGPRPRPSRCGHEPQQPGCAL